MKKYFHNIIALLAVAITGFTMAACSEDDLDTNQYRGGVTLNAWGANPLMRGGVLRFVGSNLDQIAQIKVPGVEPITNIEVVKSGIPSEIRITVPKDGPIPGKLVLVSKTDQTIETDNNIEFIEPIVIEGFTPEAVMPGEEVTIKGDYLNLIHSVTFEDGVDVSENDFTAHSRYEIKVVVPENARTGRVGLNDVDVTLIDPDEDVTYNIMETDEILEVGTPTISKIASPRGEAALQGTVVAKAGEKITVTGDFLSLVSSIKTGDADSELGQLEFSEMEISKDGKSLSFVLPATAPDGDINFICKSGVEVPVCKLETVAPTELKANNGNLVKNGAELVITGKDLDVVALVSFPNVAESIVVTPSASEIKVVVPELAQEGDITLIMANGKKVTVAYKLVQPTVTAYSANPVSAGGALSITGQNLDLVKTVKFNESETPVEVEIQSDGTLLNLTVPMDAKSGAVTLQLKNGAEVKVADITVEEAVFCYATELPGDDAELKAGETMILNVKNIDKITNVEINGTPCQYIASNDKLVIGIPVKAKKGSTVRLVSSNGEISYKIDFIPNTEVTTVLWQGQAVADNWINQPFVLTDGGKEFKDAGIVVGDVISFHITPMATDWKLQIVEGHWGPTYVSFCNVGNSNTEGGKFTEYDLDANKGYITITVTEEMLKAALTQQWWGGIFLLNGDKVVVDKITTTHYESLETTLWQGEAIADDWYNQPMLLSDAGAELAAVEAKVGQTIYFYVTPTDADWKIQIVEGHWGPTYCSFCNVGNADTEGGKFKEYDLDGNGGKIGITLTKDMLDAAYKQQYWGGTFLANGDNCKITKITIE